MRPAHAGVLALLLPVLAACAHQVDRGGTLASLHQVRPDTKEVPVDQGLDRAVQSYRDFLQQAPQSNLAPEAMRRLADLNIEKQFGIHGDGQLVELAASQSATQPAAAAPDAIQAETPGGAKGAQGSNARAGCDEDRRARRRSAARAGPRLRFTGGVGTGPRAAGCVAAANLAGARRRAAHAAGRRGCGARARRSPGGDQAVRRAPGQVPPVRLPRSSALSEGARL